MTCVHGYLFHHPDMSIDYTSIFNCRVIVRHIVARYIEFK